MNNLNSEIKIFDKYGNHSNKGKSWTDEELREILSAAPTKENTLKFAKKFSRTTSSIALIYKWAATPNHVIENKRPHNKYIRQIKRISKELGRIS